MVGVTTAVRIMVLNFIECFPVSASVLRTSLEYLIRSSRQPHREVLLSPFYREEIQGLSGPIPVA